MSSEKIVLPSVNLHYPGRKHDSRVLMLAGGRMPDRKWLQEAADASDVVWAVDRGTDICASAEIIPEIVVGDMDSISAATLSWIESRNIPVERHPVEKDLTDLQLAVVKLEEKYSNAALLISGSLGGRLDHTLSNLFTGVWCMKSGVKSVVLGDNREMLTILEGPSRMTLDFEELPSDLSLISLSEICRGVSLSGTFWELSNQDLDMYKPYSISNRVRSESRSVEVEVGSGWLGVYLNK